MIPQGFCWCVPAVSSQMQGIDSSYLGADLHERKAYGPSYPFGRSSEHLSPPPLPPLSTRDHLRHPVTEGESNSPAVSGLLSCQHKNLRTRRNQGQRVNMHISAYTVGSSAGGRGGPSAYIHECSLKHVWSYSKYSACCCCCYSFSFCITALLNIPMDHWQLDFIWNRENILFTFCHCRNSLGPVGPVNS